MAEPTQLIPFVTPKQMREFIERDWKDLKQKALKQLFELYPVVDTVNLVDENIVLNEDATKKYCEAVNKANELKNTLSYGETSFFGEVIGAESYENNKLRKDILNSLAVFAANELGLELVMNDTLLYS